MKKIIAVIAIVCTNTLAFGQCAVSSSIYSFNFNGHRYEVVKENKNWKDANSCATERGGHLLEINSSAEQVAVNSALNNAGISSNNTKAPDGGNASYLWTAGNDRQTEGKWVWENSGAQFWSGAVSGTAASGAYTHWGSVQMKEPDNFVGEQHALGLAITDWPNGLKGEWNDIKESNTLYYIVEFDKTLGLLEISDREDVAVFPNPSNGLVNVQLSDTKLNIRKADVYDMAGRIVLTVADAAGIKTLDMSGLVGGVYIVRLVASDDKRVVKRIQIF